MFQRTEGSCPKQFFAHIYHALASLGFEGHFARLQLLDATKYTDADKFIEEEKGYAELNSLIHGLPGSKQALVENYELDDSLDDEHLINQLLDCHGIGRVT